MNNLSELLPRMLFGEELRREMTVLPEYCEEFRNMEPGQRFLQLNDIYKVFVPQSMAYEIYHKLYMMTAISLKQKGTVESIRQMKDRKSVV